MKPIIHVLMVGLEDTPAVATNPSSAYDYRFIAATVHSDIAAVTATETLGAAVLDPALSLDELARYAQFVRWRWPAARILVVRAEEPHIDDALYDDRVEPGLSPELLLASIDWAIHKQRHENEAVRLWEC